MGFLTNGYKDPDAAAAEHLTAAAENLIAIAENDMADAIIQKICKLFESIELDPKSNVPVKKLGAVSYYAAGLIVLDKHTCNNIYSATVPAPKYDAASKPDDKARNARIANESRAAGWFPSKQIIAAMTGKKINTGNFKPAKNIKAIMSICEKYGTDMPIEAMQVLSAKLFDIIEAFPLSRRSQKSAIGADLIENAGRYYFEDLYSEYGFAWLSKQALQKAQEILSRNQRTNMQELNSLPKQIIKWHGLSDPEIRNVKHHVQVSNADRDMMPFFKTYDAIHNEHIEHRYDKDYPPFIDSQVYKLHLRLCDAVDITMHAYEMQRCYEALYDVEDEFARELFKSAGLIDENVQPHENLYQQAGQMYLRSQKGFDEKLMHEALEALDTLFNESECRAYFKKQ